MKSVGGPHAARGPDSTVLNHQKEKAFERICSTTNIAAAKKLLGLTNNHKSHNNDSSIFSHNSLSIKNPCIITTTRIIIRPFIYIVIILK